MENILITGVAGFIGSNLAERLLKLKYNVIGIDNLSYGVIDQIPKNVKFYKLDIRDKKIYDLFKNIDYVFHFAAKNCITDCQINPLETFDINVNGTINIFEACRINKIEKIIYAESSAIYENSKNYPTPEWDTAPESFYALSKISTNYLSNAYMKYFNLKFTALRYFNVYGPKQDYRRTIPPLFSSFIIKLLKNENPIIYGNGEKRRDFIHIDDINDFHLMCLNDERTNNKVFNLGNGINYSVNDIYSMISKNIKKNIRPVYKDNLPGETYMNLADISEAKKLGWSPKITMENGLKTSINFIKKEIKKGNI